MTSESTRARSWQVALLVLASAGWVACDQSGYSVCGSLVCPAGYQCLENQCVSGEQLLACTEKLDEERCDAAGLDGLCRLGFCQIDLCGNGQLDTYPARGPEACDGELGQLACADVGFDFGQTTCTGACTADTSKCRSFGWVAASTGQGVGRVVETAQGATFLARAGQLAWRQPTTRWRSVSRQGHLIGDVIPLATQQALVVSTEEVNTLGLWHYKATSNVLEDTALRIDTRAMGVWRGGVALTATDVLAAVGPTLMLYRITTQWTSTVATVNRTECPTPGDIEVLWRANGEVALGSIGSDLVRLSLDGDTVTCSRVRTLPAPVVAVGGVPGKPPTVGWVVTRDGKVVDGAGNVLNADPSDIRILDTAVGPATGTPGRIWATSGDDILVFEGGSWWKSSTGSAILPDNLNGRVGLVKPMALAQDRVLAVAAVQEAGLVEKAEREWMTGWESISNGEVTALTTRGNGESWAALFQQVAGRTFLARGSAVREPLNSVGARVITKPIVTMTFVGDMLYVGNADGVFRVNPQTMVAEEEGALASVRGIWAHGTTLYTASTGAFRVKQAGALGQWTALATMTDCGAIVGFAGNLVNEVPRVFALCRNEGVARLFLATPAGTVASVVVPDGPYNRIAVERDGTVWMVGGNGRVVRAPAPYDAPQILPPMRRSPVTGLSAKISDALHDVAILGNGEVYIAGANHNLFWWDGTRLVRVSASKPGGTTYVALTARGDQLYAAHEAGVDLLLRTPAPAPLP